MKIGSRMNLSGEQCQDCVLRGCSFYTMLTRFLSCKGNSYSKGSLLSRYKCGDGSLRLIEVFPSHDQVMVQTD